MVSSNRLGELKGFRFLKDHSLHEEEIGKRHLHRRLRDLSYGEVLNLLEMLFKEPYRRAPWADMLRMALLDYERLVESVGRSWIEALRGLAERTGMKGGLLLSQIPPYREGISGYTEEEEASMEYIPLGERISLAKGMDMGTLNRLLPDPDPRVVKALLDNPRITESEVIKIASKRPNSQKVLKVISLHRRWIFRYRVRKALVCNPYTPPRIAIILLTGFLQKDVELIAGNPGLHPLVREVATRMVEG